LLFSGGIPAVSHRFISHELGCTNGIIKSAVLPCHPAATSYDKLGLAGWGGYVSSRDCNRRSATGQKLQLFGVPSPLHSDLGGRVIDVMQIVGREFD
jgi:hypothetical protein